MNALEIGDPVEDLGDAGITDGRDPTIQQLQKYLCFVKYLSGSVVAIHLQRTSPLQILPLSLPVTIRAAKNVVDVEDHSSDTDKHHAVVDA